MKGDFKFPIKLGQSFVVISFLVFEKLAAPLLLCTSSFDSFGEAIRPKPRLLEGNNVSIVPIICRHLKTGLSAPVAEDLHESTEYGSQSQNISALEKKISSAHSQTWLELSTRRHGLIILEENHNL